MSTPTQAPLRIGVLYEETQMSDLIGLDILGNLTPKYLELSSAVFPALAELKDAAVPMEFLYIASSDAAWTTPDMHVRPTHTYENAPRDLDIIIVAGPNPATVKEESLVFLREASKKTKTILSVCSGGIWLAKSGVLDGKNATTNRVMLEMGKHFCPAVKWLDQRWTIDKGHFEGAEIWTAGGAGCGIDMVIEYAKAHFNEKLVQMGCLGLDFDCKGRGQFYQESLPILG